MQQENRIMEEEEEAWSRESQEQQLTNSLPDSLSYQDPWESYQVWYRDVGGLWSAQILFWLSTWSEQ